MLARGLISFNNLLNQQLVTKQCSYTLLFNIYSWHIHMRRKTVWNYLVSGITWITPTNQHLLTWVGEGWVKNYKII